jgi:WD40 repeat protein
MTFIILLLSVLLISPAASAAETAAEKPALVVKKAHEDGNIQRIAFTRGGEGFITESLDGLVEIWAVKGKLVKTLTSHGKGVAGLSVSADGEMFATSALDGSMIIWNAHGKPIATVDRGSKETYSVAFSPDGKKVACAAGMKVDIWSVSEEKIASLEVYESAVIDVHFLPDGSLIAASYSGKNPIKLWSGSAEFNKNLLASPGNLISLSLSRDGTAYASGGYSGIIQVSRFDSDVALEFNGFRYFAACPVALSPDGKKVAYASLSKGSVTIADTVNRTFIELKGVSEEEIVSLMFSPDGRLLASGSMVAPS